MADRRNLQNELEPGHCPEVALWRAVIHRALMDACGFLGGEDWRARLRMQKEAHSFFTDNSREFRDICFAADIDPDWCREECAAIIARVADGRTTDIDGRYMRTQPRQLSKRRPLQSA